MSSTKNTVVVAVTGKLETTYNGGTSASLHGPDSILVAEQIEVSPEYAFDGVRSMPPGTFGTNRRVGPSGRTVSFTLPIESKGAGTAYTASVDTVPSIQNLLLASRMSGSMNANSWSFRPNPESVVPSSMGLNVYHRGLIRPISGAYANFQYTFDSAAPPRYQFEVQGTTALPSDVALPAVVYEAGALLPAKAENIRLLLNFGTAVSSSIVRSITFNLGQEISPRLDLNVSAGHGGFALGRRNPKLNIVLEAEAFSLINPETLWSVGTNGTVSYIVGDSPGNTTKVVFEQAQIVGSAPGDDGPVATWELEIDAYTDDATEGDFEFLMY
jgi:hypothetical protein